jgi:hypothetical protein
MAFELTSPLIFLLRDRRRYLAVGFFYSFHVMTIATIAISFLPHLVALTSFLPLEKVRPLARVRRAVGDRIRRADGVRSVPVTPAPAVSGAAGSDTAHRDDLAGEIGARG